MTFLTNDCPFFWEFSPLWKPPTVSYSGFFVSYLSAIPSQYSKWAHLPFSVSSQIFVCMQAFIICLSNCPHASPICHLTSTHPAEPIDLNLSLFPLYIFSILNYMQPLQIVINLPFTVFAELILQRILSCIWVKTRP